MQFEDLERLATHLRSRRPNILAMWRGKVDLDETLSASSTLARAQFVDHIPRILDAFERRLRARDASEAKDAAAAERAGAAEHGVNRWLHGYNYRETMREWGHLQVALTDEIESFTQANERLDSIAMCAARRNATQLFVDCVVESAVGHASLQQAEAASRLSDLERVLEQLKAGEQVRAKRWHELTHDLRGNVTAVKVAANVLMRNDANSSPTAVLAIQSSAEALGSLLNDLIEVTRLEAGRESRVVAPLDVAVLLQEMISSFQPTAAEGNLFLTLSGPTSLLVNSDARKLRRIVQNLVVNALKYTERGGVQVVFGVIDNAEIPSWSCSIKDTGAGLSDDGTSLAQAMIAATDEDANVAGQSSHDTLASASSNSSAGAGEGIGLVIVKRLCELLDATIELHSPVGRGTTFRLVFPMSYGVSEG